MCKWLATEVGTDVPLHFSRYHPDYKMTSPGPTPLATLVRLRGIARQEGLRFVYIGNVAAPDGGTTFCPQCGAALVERPYAYVVSRVRLTPEGRCPDCGASVPGVWK
jgi:pyruvate formate lyase activating enzyme